MTPPRLDELQVSPQDPDAKGFSPLGLKALAYWRSNLPSRVAVLKQQGKLQQAINEAEDRTLDAILKQERSLQVEKGYSPQQATQAAEEALFPEWLFPPPEQPPSRKRSPRQPESPPQEASATTSSAPTKSSAPEP